MATSRIFIKGLPPSLSEADFRKHFSANGREVTDVKLISQRRIGYVGYKSAEDAAKAIKYFNKSYIRMSKISVEAARPISDRVQPSGRGANPDSLAGGSIRSLAADSEANGKKRKRDESAKPDSKLKEYLQVMGSGKESLVADETGVETDAPLGLSGEGLVPEGESDDEYQDVPKRLEKQRKVDHTTTEATQGALPTATALVATPQAEVPMETRDASKDSSALVSEGPVAGTNDATDDDWLRSRTNRLLDLVDPDDLPPAQQSQSNGVPDQSHGTDGNHQEPAEGDVPADTPQPPVTPSGSSESPVEAISRTSRLFVRNLPYTATEEDLQECFEKFGHVEEIHLPVTAAGAKKGFALVLFASSSDAVAAFQSMDGATFQGRLLHIIPAEAKKDHGIDEFGMSNLPLKKQNLIRKKKDAASATFNWNSLFMSQDAVNASVASRLGVSKSELLDPTSADAAVKQAIAETTVIQETKAFFAANGVDLSAFKSNKRGDTAILVKNFSYGTSMEELRKMFEEFGQVLKVLMPPTGTIAIVQYAQPNQAKAAFGKLAYRRIKDSVLFLEKAPKDLFSGEQAAQSNLPTEQRAGNQKLNVNDLLASGDKAEDDVETTSLFIRNLNFTTTTSKLAEAFQALDGFVSARVKTKMDTKKPGQTLSMGFGFAEFRSKAQAQAAIKVMDGYVLENHALTVKASHRGQDAAEERRKEDKAKKAAAQRTKIVVKNLPFQATKQDIRTLFGTYGQLRSVRLPKKADYTSRGFAFADFVTPREAENALNALKDTHLLGRRLVLDFAEAEALDAEEEIEKMQRKVGGQAHKVALQQLTGGGRKRVNIGNEDEDMEE